MGLLKPKHQGGYSPDHTALCERTLVTLLRGLGPWKAGVYLAGGLVPRYLIPDSSPERRDLPPHAGTTDVDLILDLEVLATVAAYRRLEQNLQALGFIRGANDEGQTQHFSWRKPIQGGVTVVVDLLGDADLGDGGRVAEVPRERRLSVLKLPGAHLVVNDFISVPLSAELLDGRGVANETIRVANIVPFIVLKALAYDDRMEQKDAYDLIYCLMYYGSGPEAVAARFAEQLRQLPDEPLLRRGVKVLRDRFAADPTTPAIRKDGPISYAQFLTDPGRTEQDLRHRQNAGAVVEIFLSALEAHQS